MNTQILRTTSQNPDFINLVKLLDSYLKIVDGDDHAFYDQYNSIEDLKMVVVLYKNEQAVACGSIKKYDSDSVEVKRMFTLLEERGNGLASVVLTELENWASETGYASCILETGHKQVEAIELYKKNGYTNIPNYGQYAQIENSVCFKKLLTI
ncbi:MAG: GNAT family N-acetyltransferase [Bacteroidetes bacterium]|nr:MAG: GNAT family N-acetyltransferase [Bacteroidota bacterium]